MRNPNFTDHLQAWATGHDLKPSARFPCGHGVSGNGLKSTEHILACLGQRLDLLDHATLFNVAGSSGRVLIAFPYRPRPEELGSDSYLHRLKRYATTLGIAGLMPSALNLLHGLYATDTCVVLYGTKGLDLAALSTGISESWVHKPNADHMGIGRREREARLRDIRREAGRS